jgi:hypothetical protein
MYKNEKFSHNRKIPPSPRRKRRISNPAVKSKYINAYHGFRICPSCCACFLQHGQSLGKKEPGKAELVLGEVGGALQGNVSYLVV